MGRCQKPQWAFSRFHLLFPTVYKVNPKRRRYCDHRERDRDVLIPNRTSNHVDLWLGLHSIRIGGVDLDGTITARSTCEGISLFYLPSSLRVSTRDVILRLVLFAGCFVYASERCFMYSFRIDELNCDLLMKVIGIVML